MPAIVIGYEIPEGIPLPHELPSIADEERGKIFCTWVSAYHRHPFYELDQESREKSISNLITHVPEGVEKYRPSTFETFTPEEIQTCLHPEAAVSEHTFLKLDLRTLRDLMLGTLLVGHGQDGDSNSALPELRIDVVYCQASFWLCPYAIWKIEEDIEKWKKDGKRQRPIRINSFPNVNHCVSMLRQ